MSPGGAERINRTALLYKRKSNKRGRNDKNRRSLFISAPPAPIKYLIEVTITSGS